jgi:hypothetical protein
VGRRENEDYCCTQDPQCGAFFVFIVSS